MSATTVSREIGELFSKYRWMIGGTHAGNPTAAAAALAACEACRDEGLIERGRALGDYLEPRLTALRAVHRCVGALHGRGAFWSFELTKNRETREHFIADGRDLGFGGDLSTLPGAIVAREALRRGVFLRHDGPETVQVAPPLVASETECDTALEALDAGLAILDTLCTSSRGVLVRRNQTIATRSRAGQFAGQAPLGIRCFGAAFRVS
jgi:taurine--2-oxoglutarate transaminase